MSDQWGEDCVQTAEERCAEQLAWAEREVAKMPRRSRQWDQYLNLRLRPNVKNLLVAMFSLKMLSDCKASDVTQLAWNIGADSDEHEAIYWAWQTARMHPESIEPVEDNVLPPAEPRPEGPLVQCTGTLRGGDRCANRVPMQEGDRCWAHKRESKSH